MRRAGWMIMAVLAAAALTGCASKQEDTERVEMTAQPTPTLSPEEKEAALLEQPEIVEAITVGDSQVALRQGEKKHCVEFVLYQEEQEKLLASLNKKLEISKCHIEPFDGKILGYEGFYLFEKDANWPYSYVYYIGLKDNGQAKILFINNASYREKKKKFETVFEEVRDIDGDGIREVISNEAYVVDGGQEAVIYDCDEKGRILEGYLGDLIDCDYYHGRATDFRVWYYPKNRKVWITFYPSKYAGDQVTKKYKLNKKSLKKIKMRHYKSDNLKDLGKYY